MRLLKKVNYKKAVIRVYLYANVQHICKVRLPWESSYTEIGEYPRLDTIDNLIKYACNEVDYYIDDKGNRLE